MIETPSYDVMIAGTDDLASEISCLPPPNQKKGITA